ncbi:MAG: NAD+ synthase [Deltaproteobacteria bacterium]|nr:NAD+ synthase [Deltaproteobacteria bacterium]
MKIALVPLNPTVGHIAHNNRLATNHIDRAIALECDLIIFPELSLIGYPPKDYLFYKQLIEEQNQSLVRLRRKSKKIAIITGGVTLNRGIGAPFKNTAFIMINGQQHVYTKQLLPNYDVFDESRYFEAGTEPLVLKIGGKKFGLSVCEDIWSYEKDTKKRYRINPVEGYKNQALDFFVNIAASPFELDKLTRRKELLYRVADDLDCTVVFVNQSGGNDDLVFDGGALVVGPARQTLFQSPLFEDNVFVYDTGSPVNGGVDQVTHLTLTRSNSSILRGVHPHSVDCDIPTYPDNRMALLLKALITGTRDYCHKTGFKQVVLGLSGGVDSALTAFIASQALGAENVLGVMLPSRYSSKGSLTDAKKLARNLQMAVQPLEINTIHKALEKTLRQIFKKNVSDITAQNIQARIRAVILMAIANNTNRLLLNTSNKSEAAMGYGTLYGDMCGALAVIGDLTKTQIYELCRHINREREIIPAEIINKAPSAELKPNQKDTDSLPPYPVLDPIVEDFIDRFVINKKNTGSNFTATEIVQKILANEYKRYQAPPCLKVTGKAFGTGRRMPIAAKVTS